MLISELDGKLDPALALDSLSPERRSEIAHWRLYRLPSCNHTVCRLPQGETTDAQPSDIVSTILISIAMSASAPSSSSSFPPVFGITKRTKSTKVTDPLYPTLPNVRAAACNHHDYIFRATECSFHVHFLVHSMYIAKRMAEGTMCFTLI